MFLYFLSWCVSIIWILSERLVQYCGAFTDCFRLQPLYEQIWPPAVGLKTHREQTELLRSDEAFKAFKFTLKLLRVPQTALIQNAETPDKRTDWQTLQMLSNRGLIPGTGDHVLWAADRLFMWNMWNVDHILDQVTPFGFLKINLCTPGWSSFSLQDSHFTFNTRKDFKITIMEFKVFLLKSWKVFIQHQINFRYSSTLFSSVTM